MGPLGVAVSFRSEAMYCVSVSSSCSSTRKEAVSKVKRKSAILKRAMTGRHERWPKKEWYNKTKSHWRTPAGGEVGKSSHDKWRSSKPQGNWKEISAEIDAVETIVKVKTNTSNEKLPREGEESSLSTKGKSIMKEACSRTFYSNFKKKERRRERLVG